MYNFFKNILFRFDAERVHYFSMDALRVICATAAGRKIIRAQFSPKAITTQPLRFARLTFRNMAGLAAGFDKNGKYLRELECLGFGYVEIGTVTPLPQAGNEKPRLFRLPKDRAIINRMGFNNDGVVAVAKRLETFRNTYPHLSAQGFKIGGNIGKNKQTANEDAHLDYAKCFTALYPHVDYFVVNVSSPNTPGLRALQDAESLKKIFSSIYEIRDQASEKKPVFLKIAPELSKEQVDEVLKFAKEISLDGLVVSNTTISRSDLKTDDAEIREIGAGGLSGAPLKQRSTELIRYIAEQTNGTLPIIGSGGIFTAADAKEKLAAGATMIQVWTGFIYQGPRISSDILRG